VRALLADGRYVPAIYCHWRNADAIRADVQPLATAAGQGPMRFWIARSAGFSLDRVPTDAGFAFAYAWQGALDVSRTWNGRTLVIDENVAATASPSAP
jgi:hypothetical protein